MSISINEIHYAVEITFDRVLPNNPDIGLNDSRLRYITDGYDPTLDSFEDLSPVTGTWYGDMLQKEGIKTSSQSISIIQGGDVSWASNLNVVLVNFGGLHKRLLTTSDMFLVGSKMQMWVIIDSVWYSVWVGVVGEYQFDQESFTFIGKDKNNADSNSLTNMVIGTSVNTTIPIKTDLGTQLIMESRPVRSYQPRDKNNMSAYITEPTSPGAPNPDQVADMQKEYSGGGFSQKYTLDTNQQVYDIEIVGEFPKVKKGMYLQVDTDSVLHYISEVKIVGQGAFDSTIITVSGDVGTILDTSQFYGIVGSAYPPEVITEMRKYTETTMTVSVYDKGVRLEPLEAGLKYNIYDVDKLDVYDREGNLITVRVIENPDRSLTILDTSYAVITKPKHVSYWGSNDVSFQELIDQGAATHLEDKMGMWVKVPQDFDVTNPNDYNYFITERKKYHYFMMEFEDSAEGGIPFSLVNGLSNSKEVWTWQDFGGTWPDLAEAWQNGLYDPSLPYIDQDGTKYWTSFSSPYVNTSVNALDSRFRGYRITTYRVMNDGFYGKIPLVVDEYTLPNLRYAISAEPIDPTNSVWETTSVSANATNLPITLINGDNTTSTATGLRDWGYVTEPELSLYPKGKMSLFEAKGTSIDFSKDGTKDVKSRGNAILIMIMADDLDIESMSDKEFQILTGSGANQHYVNQDNFQFGVNAMGTYKISTIDSIADVTIPIVDMTSNTLPKALSKITGTFVDIPERDGWFVGGQIQNENKFSGAITTLCQQSFVVGATDRHGELQFNTFLEE